MFDYILAIGLQKNHTKYVETVAYQVKGHSRSLPSLVMDLALPAGAILCESDIKYLRLVEHLMVETQDTLVFCVRSLRRLGWRHNEFFEMISMWSIVFLIIDSYSGFNSRRPRLLGDEARSSGRDFDG